MTKFYTKLSTLITEFSEESEATGQGSAAGHGSYALEVSGPSLALLDVCQHVPGARQAPSATQANSQKIYIFIKPKHFNSFCLCMEFVLSELSQVKMVSAETFLNLGTSMILFKDSTKYANGKTVILGSN